MNIEGPVGKEENAGIRSCNVLQDAQSALPVPSVMVLQKRCTGGLDGGDLLGMLEWEILIGDKDWGYRDFFFDSFRRV